MTIQIGDIVQHKNPFHVRGASTGAVELIDNIGYQVWWEEDNDNQIHPAFRNYYESELKIVGSQRYN